MTRHRAAGALGPFGLGTYRRAQTDPYGPADRERTEQAFVNGNPPGPYSPYLSQTGAQGFGFILLDRFFHPSSPEPFRFLTALATALTVSAIVLWAALEFNMGAALGVLAAALTSGWLVVFGRNLYWVSWTWFAPMVAMMWLLYRERRRSVYSILPICAAVFALVLVKCLAGYEYLSTVLLAAATPVVYYGVQGRWGRRVTLMRVIAVGVAGVLAFGVAMTIHASLFGGSVREGLAHIASDAQRRTYSSKGAFGDVYSKSFEAPAASVLKTYVTAGSPFGAVPDLRGDDVLALPIWKRTWLLGRDLQLRLMLNRVSIFWMSAFFAVAAFLYWRRDRDPRFDALMWTVPLCALAPVSWFVLAKAHSYIHTHINYVLWDLPYVLLMGAFLGGVTWKRVMS